MRTKITEEEAEAHPNWFFNGRSPTSLAYSKARDGVAAG